MAKDKKATGNADNWVLDGRREGVISPEIRPLEAEETEETIDANVSFDEFAISVERFKYVGSDDDAAKYEYHTSVDGVALKGETEAKILEAAASHMNGKAIKMANKSRAGFTRTWNEGSKWAIDNSPEYEPLAAKDLTSLGKSIKKAVEAEEKSAVARRKAAFGLGADLNAAYQQLVDDRNTVDGKVDNKLNRAAKAAWGAFLEEWAPSIAPSGKNKNKVGEHRNLTKLPAEYWEFAPIEKSSAKALNTWHDANRNELAAYLVDVALTAYENEHSDDYDAFVAQCRESAESQKAAAVALAESEVFAQIVEVDRKALANDAVAFEHVAETVNVETRNIEKESERNAKAAEIEAGLLRCMTAKSVVYSGDLVIQIAKNVKSAVMRAAADLGTEETPAMTEAQAATEAVSTVAKGFHNFDPEEAAQHLWNILQAKNTDDTKDEINVILDRLDELAREALETENADE